MVTGCLKLPYQWQTKSTFYSIYTKEDYLCGYLHPGLVSTRMTGFTRNGISPEESANGLLKRIDSLNKKNSGTFWHANGEVLPW